MPPSRNGRQDLTLPQRTHHHHPHPNSLHCAASLSQSPTSRQAMSRGGKLAPEVNRYAPHSLCRKPTAASSLDPPLTASTQCSVRQESELQRHPRGSLRPLRQVRPCAVRRPIPALAPPAADESATLTIVAKSARVSPATPRALLSSSTRMSWMRNLLATS